MRRRLIAIAGCGLLFVGTAVLGSAGQAAAGVGDLSIYAGTGTTGPWHTSGKATKLALNQPHGLAYDPTTSGDRYAGDLFIDDTADCAVRYVNRTGKKMKTLVNRTAAHPCGPVAPGPASKSPLNHADGLTFDAAHHVLYIADAGNGQVDTVSLGGGTPVLGVCPTGTPTARLISHPTALGIDTTTGDLYVADEVTDVIVRYTYPCATAVPQVVAGVLNTVGFNGDSQPCTTALLDAPNGVAFDATTDTVYIGDTGNNEIRACVPGAPPMIEHVLGTPPGSGFTPDGNYPGGVVSISAPHGIKIDGAGSIFFDEVGNDLVRKFDTSSNLVTIAGGGAQTPPLPPAPPISGTNAKLGGPHGLIIVPTSPTTADVLFSDTPAPPSGTTSVLRVQGVAVP